MSEICCVLQGMMGGYPPGLPPLQGPVDGLVSMGSMQPLHPGGPPPHHLPPGVPGLPGIPPPGKNFILICSLISSSHSFSSLNQSFQVAPAAHCDQAFSYWKSEMWAAGPVMCIEQMAPAPVSLCSWLPCSSVDHMTEARLSRLRGRRHALLSSLKQYDMCLGKKRKKQTA